MELLYGVWGFFLNVLGGCAFVVIGFLIIGIPIILTMGVFKFIMKYIEKFHDFIMGE